VSPLAGFCGHGLAAFFLGVSEPTRKTRYWPGASSAPSGQYLAFLLLARFLFILSIGFFDWVLACPFLRCLGFDARKLGYFHFWTPAAPLVFSFFCG
jgi:hypothetical protein